MFDFGITTWGHISYDQSRCTSSMVVHECYVLRV